MIFFVTVVTSLLQRAFKSCLTSTAAENQSMTSGELIYCDCQARWMNNNTWLWHYACMSQCLWNWATPEQCAYYACIQPASGADVFAYKLHTWLSSIMQRMPDRYFWCNNVWNVKNVPQHALSLSAIWFHDCALACVGSSLPARWVGSAHRRCRCPCPTHGSTW